MADLIVRPHILSDFEQRFEQVPEGANVAQMVEAFAPDMAGYCTVFIEDGIVPREHWARVRPREGKRVFIAVVPEGGKRGKGILGAIAMIAVAVVAWYAAPALAAGMGFTGTALTVATGAIAGTITAVGSLALSALFKPAGFSGAVAGYADTPAYSMSGQSNVAAQYGPVQRVYGRMRIYPRVAAQPVVFTRGGVSWLQTVYSCGYGPLAIEDIRIGDTPIGQYANARVWVHQSFIAGDSLAAYTNDHFYESLGMTLNMYEARTSYTRENSDRAIINLSFPAGIYAIGGDGKNYKDEAQFRITMRDDATGNAYTLPGEWLVNAALVNGWGRYDAGTTAVWLGSETPQTKALTGSIEFAFPYRGRWAVTIEHLRSNDPAPDDRVIQFATFEGLQSVTYRQPIAPRKPMTLIEIEVQANDQLSGTIQNLSCIATSILAAPWAPGQSWATRDPAMIYYDILTGTANPRPVDPTRVDVARLQEWSNYCYRTAQDGEPYAVFDTVIDGKTTVWEMLNNVAACGRATPTMRDGMYSVLIDQYQSTPVQVFTQRNATSFSGDRPYPDVAHCLRVKFIDPSSNWQQREVLVYDDGYDASNATRYETLDTVGITRPGQAWRDGRYMLAQAKLRRETLTLGVDVENLICMRGDLVAFAYDVLKSGGVPARVLAINADGSMKLDEYLVGYTAGTTYGMVVRSPSNLGGSQATYVSPVETDGDTVRWNEGPTVPVSVGDLVVIGVMSSVTALYLVKGVTPAEDMQATLELVEQAPGVYSADTGPIPPYYPSADGRPPGDLGLPAIQGLIATTRYEQQSQAALVSVILSWQRPPQTSMLWYRVEKLADDGVNWVAVGNPRTTELVVIDRMNQLDLPAPPDGLPLTYRVIGVTVSGRETAPAQISLTLMRDETPPVDVVNLRYAIESYAIRLEWDENTTNADLAGYLVEYLGPEAQALADAEEDIAEGGLPVSLLATKYRWQMRDAGRWRVGIRAFNVLSVFSVTRTEIVVQIDAPGTPSNLLSTVAGPNIVLSWEEILGSFALDRFDIYRAGNYIASAYTTSYSEKLIALGQIDYGVVAVDVAGNRSAMVIVSQVVSPPKAMTLQATILGNNVLLRWLDAATTLPIQFYEIRLGATWEDSIPKANVGNGRAITFFEEAAGTYTYWVRAVDSAGNVGQASSVTVQLAQPPDYVLRFDWDSDFVDAVLVNAHREGMQIWVPITDETWQEHFVNNSWNSPQDQVDAGFPRYWQPSADVGTFDQVFDYGAIQPPTTVTATLTYTVPYGDVDVIPMLSYRADEADPWTDVPGVAQAFISDFRYVKVHYDFEANGPDGLALVTGLNIKLAVQRKTDEGYAQVYAADPEGTAIPFNTQFVDVMSVVVTPQGTTPVLQAVEFDDVPYPVNFRVYLFDLDGNRVDGYVYWTARGV